MGSTQKRTQKNQYLKESNDQKNMFDQTLLKFGREKMRKQLIITILVLLASMSLVSAETPGATPEAIPGNNSTLTNTTSTTTPTTTPVENVTVPENNTSINEETTPTTPVNSTTENTNGTKQPSHDQTIKQSLNNTVQPFGLKGVLNTPLISTTIDYEQDGTTTPITTHPYQELTDLEEATLGCIFNTTWALMFFVILML